MPAKPLDPVFLNIFTSWFNLDSIDLGDTDELLETAGVAAADLSRQYKNLDKNLEPLIEDLERSIASWRPDFLMQLINATSVDWLFDASSEAALRLVLQQIVSDLKLLAHKGEREQKE